MKIIDIACILVLVLACDVEPPSIDPIDATVTPSVAQPADPSAGTSPSTVTTAIATHPPLPPPPVDCVAGWCYVEGPGCIRCELVDAGID